jgi:Protein of unknown function (DUF669).
MSFWSTSTGESAITETKSFEIEGGGNMAPIPDGAHVLSMIADAKWAETRDKDATYINIKWDVLKPEPYANRKVFQKLWVGDLDPSVKDKDKAVAKRDKALRMFSVIDANAGGKLAKLREKPDDDDLAAALVGKMMVIGVRVWETKNAMGDDASGNWVYFVGEKNSELKEGAVKAGKPVSKASFKEDIADDLPF